MHKIIQICGIAWLLIPIFLECHCELYWSHNPLRSCGNSTEIVQEHFLENTHVREATPHNYFMNNMNNIMQI